MGGDWVQVVHIYPLVLWILNVFLLCIVHSSPQTLPLGRDAATVTTGKMKQGIFPFSPSIELSLKPLPCSHRPALAPKSLGNYERDKRCAIATRMASEMPGSLRQAQCFCKPPWSLPRRSTRCCRFLFLNVLGNGVKTTVLFGHGVGGDDSVMGFGPIFLNSVCKPLFLVKHRVWSRSPVEVIILARFMSTWRSWSNPRDGNLS